MMHKILVVFGVLLLAGCASRLSTTVDEYSVASKRVELGMNKEQVATILQPTQARLDNDEIKRPDRYVKEDGTKVDILYFRSGFQNDGLTTDDEFTPYIFHDNKLVGIGWEMLGGPKTQAQARDRDNIHFQFHHGFFHRW